MMKKRVFWSVLAVLMAVLLFTGCLPNVVDNDSFVVEERVLAPALLGSWEMTSVHWVTADTTYSNAKVQPGIFMIDGHRYSTMWTPSEEPRVPFKNLSEPTDEELIAGFRSVVFNAGTYEMTDSTLTTTAVIAKVPGFEGGIQYYRYKIEGKVLELTMFDETYPDGGKPRWLGKYVTKFVYRRVE